MDDIQMFTVMGEPRGKQRARTYRNGNFTRTVTPEQTVIYENLIALEYRRQCGNFRFEDKEMLEITIEAHFSVPKSTSKKNRALMIERALRPVKKPDGDNIIKVVCDALNGVAYHDDAQIVDMIVRKYYAEAPKLVISIREVK